METKEIQELLAAYVRHGSESAFRELVNRYLSLVYSAALRQVNGNAHLAEDIAQAVFTDLARKARALPAGVLLGGWLHKHTCFVAANHLRSERRRVDRENQAAQMNTLNNSGDDWKQIAPVLDEAINGLESDDRDAVTLRYFEGRDYHAIGAALGVSDDTAQKRVSRALGKLRESLVKHGVSLSAAALGTLLANQGSAALPPRLADNIAGAALTNAAGSTGVLSSLLTLKVGLLVALLAGSFALIPPIKNRLNRASQTVAPEIASAPGAEVASVPGTVDNSAREDARQTSLGTTQGPSAVKVESANVLTLTVLSADTQRPIANATVELRAQAGKWVTKTLTADRAGVCLVESIPDLKTLQLTTQIKGFADTRLSWNVERGEKVPLNYTLAVERAVLIGGTVLDPEGNPVEGSKVGFNHDEDPISKKLPESHEFSWIEVKTDNEGRWQIDRIASDMLPRLYGSAKHTNFVDSPFATVSREAGMEEQLRIREHVFRLGNGLTIHGSVMDAENFPVAGANVFFGGLGAGPRETKSLADGSFSISGCKPTKNLLSAEAKGFAATTIEIDPSTDSGPYKLQLQRGKTLRLLIVDKNGAPVPKASVWLQTMPRYDSSKLNPKPVQANFDGKTDNSGRLVWNSAPDGELKFYVHKPGYMSLRDLKLEANNEEHAVALPPALIVSGTVTDENGRPIPRFKIICGFPNKYIDRGTREENWSPSWSTFERDWLSFVGGNYKHSFEDAMLMGTKNPGYILKFEADGYATIASRLIEPDEGEVQINVVLRRATRPIVTVFLPDGSPAAKADVGLVSPGARLSLMPGGFSRENIQSGTSLMATDTKGQFRLPSDDAISRVIFAHPDGYADTTLQDLTFSPKVYLQPWGTLEGIYLSGGKPVVGRELILGFGNNGGGGLPDLSYDFQHRVRTDNKGRFVFPKALPGNQKLIALIPDSVPANSWSHTPIQDVTIRSGEISEVTIGNSGLQD